MDRRTELLALLAFMGAACGGGGDTCPEGTVPAGDGCVVAVDGGGGDGALGPDAACDPEGPDPIDQEGRDENCDGTDGVVAEQVYVATTGDDSNVGTPTSPVRSISRAVEIAGTRRILVSTGTYVGSVEKTGGFVRIHGGYLPDQGWTRGGDNTMVSAESGGWRLIDLTADSIVERIDLSSAAATGDGQSSIVLMVSGSGVSMSVAHTTVDAGAGADGVAGEIGGSGTLGTPGASGDICRRSGGGDCIAGTVLATSAPTPACSVAVAVAGTGGGTNQNGGTSGAGRAGGAKNTTPGMAAGPGESGADGAAGANGAGGAVVGGFLISGYAPATADDGAAGAPGEGGGGGGGGVLYASDACGGETVYAFTPSGSAGGSGGNGGCGGAPGTGGQGGGGSIGIVASGVSLTLSDVTVRTALGGRGGAGGDGGTGGTGGSGGPGGAGACGMDGATVVRGDPGGTGGAGGDGGRGGHGGGGMGGPSVGVVLLAGAELSQQDTTIDPGAGGFGGASAGNLGATGVSQDVLTIE